MIRSRRPEPPALSEHRARLHPVDQGHPLGEVAKSCRKPAPRLHPARQEPGKWAMLAMRKASKPRAHRTQRHDQRGAGTAGDDDCPGQAGQGSRSGSERSGIPAATPTPDGPSCRSGGPSSRRAARDRETASGACWAWPGWDPWSGSSAGLRSPQSSPRSRPGGRSGCGCRPQEPPSNRHRPPAPGGAGPGSVTEARPGSWGRCRGDIWQKMVREQERAPSPNRVG